ncbi:MAG TPA: hypothetical protein VNJ08_08570 [Bacteriovoracaceae bacterium]|nr:hypothetical protein [Bacteriovoracaceae bacterium]
MNKIKIYKIVVLLLLGLMMFAFNNCIQKAPSYNSTSSRSPSSSISIPTPGETEVVSKTEAEILQAIQVSTGIKNFEQILHTMSEVTGVSSQNAGIKSIYAQVQTSLPNENDVKVFMASHQVAVTKLAAEYCQVLVETAALRVIIWPNFNFGLTIAGNAFSAANREYLIESAIDAFWIVPTDEEKMQTVEQVSPLFDELMAAEATGSTTVTRGIVKGVCTVILSSAQVTLL